MMCSNFVVIVESWELLGVEEQCWGNEEDKIIDLEKYYIFVEKK